MRSLATRVLVGANEPRKKVYPINYLEVENDAMVSESTDLSYASANWTTTSPEDEDVDPFNKVTKMPWWFKASRKT